MQLTDPSAKTKVKSSSCTTILLGLDLFVVQITTLPLICKITLPEVRGTEMVGRVTVFPQDSASINMSFFFF